MKIALFWLALCLIPAPGRAAPVAFTAAEASAWSAAYGKARTARLVNGLGEGLEASVLLRGLEAASASAAEKDSWLKRFRANKLSPLERLKALRVEESQNGWKLILPGLQRVNVSFERLGQQIVIVNGKEIALEGLSVTELHQRVSAVMTTKKSVTEAALDLLLPSAYAGDARAKFVAASVTAFVLAVAADREEHPNPEAKKLTAADMLARFRDNCRKEIQKKTPHAKSDTALFMKEFSNEQRFPVLQYMRSATNCEMGVARFAAMKEETWQSFVGDVSEVCARARELSACDAELKKQKKDAHAPAEGDAATSMDPNRE